MLLRSHRLKIQEMAIHHLSYAHCPAILLNQNSKAQFQLIRAASARLIENQYLQPAIKIKYATSE